ncbi:MAG: hypothetical protein JST92_20510 [Deltaproteobacteria bacterium]|nr:hypothetical protein [Deltaproteobacteria bacterium]
MVGAVRRGDLALAGALAVLGVTLALWQGVLPRAGLRTMIDEHAYELQARTLLSGRLSLPAPALPEFFEAPQILVEPVYAAKYLPGNALFLAPGVAVGVPLLMPLLALALVCALLTLLLRRFGQPRWVAAAGALVFAVSDETMTEFPTLLSHAASTSLAVLAVLLMVALHERRDARLCALLGAAAGLSGAVRPFSGVALTLAAGVTLLSVRASWREWLALAAPLALCGVALLAFNHAITGHALVDPWRLWAQQYAPWDGPGVGPLRTTAPARAVPDHLAPLLTEYRNSRLRYMPGNLLAAWLVRARLAMTILPSPFLVLLCPLGRAAALREGLLGPLVFAVALALLQLLHHFFLRVYWLDVLPLLAILVALGLARCWTWVQPGGLADTRPRRALAYAALSAAAMLALYVFEFDIDPLGPSALVILGLLSLAAAARRSLATPQLARGCLAALALVLLVKCARDVHADVESEHREDAQNLEQFARFEAAASEVKARHGILFIRYGANAHKLFRMATPGLGVSDPPLILALDRGDDDQRLMALFPGRPAFRYDVATRALAAIPPAPLTAPRP